MKCGGCRTRGLVKRAQELHERGESLAAFETLEQAPLTPISCPGACYMKARIGMAAGLWDRSLEILEGLTEIVQPKKGLALARIECLIGLGRTDEAWEDLTRHDAAFNACFLAYMLKARIWASRGRPELTYGYLRASMKMNPEAAAARAFGCPELAPWVLGAFCRHRPVAAAG